MANRVRKPTAAEVTAKAILSELQQGRWAAGLPGYRRLSQELSVAKSTVVDALLLLEGQEVLWPVERGKRRQVRSIDQRHPLAGRGTLIVVRDRARQIGDVDLMLQSELRTHWEKAGGRVVEETLLMRSNKKVRTRVDRLIKTHQPEAVLIWVGGSSWIKEFHRANIPLFCLGGALNDLVSEVSGCGFHLEKSLIEVFQSLKDRGHWRVLCPLGPGAKEMKLAAQSAYSEVFADRASTAWAEDLCPLFTETSPQQWRDCWRKTLSSLQPTAVVCESVAHMLSLYGFTREAQIRVPQDLSIIVLEESTLLPWIWPRPEAWFFSNHSICSQFQQWLESQLRGAPFTWVPLKRTNGESVIELR